MKKIYLFALSMVGGILLSQTHISFESSEGYSLGNLHQQNNWEVTEGSDGVIQNQVISDEFSSDGSYSFKNAHEPSFDFQWFPIFGGALEFETPISADEEFSISYDVMVTGQNGADFEFTLYGINPEYDIYEPVAGVGIENRGFIYLIKADDYDFDYAETNWNSGEWIQIKVELTSTAINYYINDELDTSLPRFNNIDITGINFLHNNYGQDAYYDNFVISMENLNVNEVAIQQDFQIYPNPVQDWLKVSLENDEISSLSIFNSQGQLVGFSKENNAIYVGDLSAGVYFIQATTKNAKTFKRKLIKR